MIDNQFTADPQAKGRTDVHTFVLPISINEP